MPSRHRRQDDSRPRQRRPGRRLGRLATFLALAVTALSTGCNYGFQGGGFPPHIRTIYIAPFENETTQFDLDDQLAIALATELPAQLGLQVAGQEAADAVLTGAIVRYDDVAQNYRADEAAGNVLSHEVSIGISAELLDVRDNVIRWEARSLTGRGSYDPTSEEEEVGQAEAIEQIIEQIIDGAQSQW